MKKTQAVGLAVLVVALTSAAVGYTVVNGAKEDPKPRTENVTTSVTGNAAIQESEQHPHAEGENHPHAEGECKGHEPGQPHMEKGDNPGHGHEEGSAACQEKHAKGECKGHQPGEKHSENHGKSQE